MTLFNRFPFFYQLDQMDCGPTCLKMVATHFGRDHSLSAMKAKMNVSREGVSLLDIADVAQEIGFQAMCVKIDFEELLSKELLPCIVFVHERHFAVVYRTTKHKVYVADPSIGRLSYRHDEFRAIWCSHGEKADGGIALILKPTEAFEKSTNEPDPTGTKKKKLSSPK